MLKINTEIAVFWFRRDLRIEDNKGLFNALHSGYPVLPLFIFDTDILNQLDDKADKRVDLIRQMLVVLQQKIEQSGSTLLVRHGKPLTVFESLLAEFNIKAVYTNQDYEPYALERDADVAKLIASQSSVFYPFKDQVIFEWNEVLKADQTPYTVFTPYSKIWKQKISEKDTLEVPSIQLAEHLLKMDHVPIPTLHEIGFVPTGIVVKTPSIDLQIIENYQNTRDIPSLNGTSDLSVHLRFGTISTRKLVDVALQMNETWLNELIWREFFMSIMMHFPYVTQGAFKKKYNSIPWLNDELEFERWCAGKTGFPIVDAGMRELNETGKMHNRVRMIVASFLTKHLLIDWRWGEAYFAQKLLDYDLSANNGNWQWVAGCGCDAAPYFRVFNPSEQTKRYDPEYQYIRKWVEEFDTFDYPPPMVDHSFARNRALSTYKLALND